MPPFAQQKCRFIFSKVLYRYLNCYTILVITFYKDSNYLAKVLPFFSDLISLPFFYLLSRKSLQLLLTVKSRG